MGGGGGVGAGWLVYTTIYMYIAPAYFGMRTGGVVYIDLEKRKALLSGFFIY